MPRLHRILLASVSVLAFSVWMFWYQSNWKWMLISMLVATPIMIIDTIIRQPTKLQALLLISQLGLYLALFIYGFARLYEERGLIKFGHVIHSFHDSIYFSVVTWTTLGAGDLLPTEELKSWVAIQALYSYFLWQYSFRQYSYN
jgi:hypothetical protein